MKTIKLLISFLFISTYISAQDVVYATDLDNSKIVKVTSNPNTGVSGTFTNVKTNLTPSAALGASIDGWLYYLEYGDNSTGSGEGKVDIWCIKADGTGSPTKIINNFDMNGSIDNNLQFVRLGISASNVGWIVAKEESSNTIHLAKFTVNGNNSVTPLRAGTINTNDNSNSLFNNGDLAFDGKGDMYILGNNGSGSTKIYTIKSSILSSISTNSVIIMNSKWNLIKSDNSNFTGRVNGVAFSSTGSMYVSTDDGLYFIDQNTVNTVSLGTVKCSLVKSITGLTDLATNYFPNSTTLPVEFIKVEFKKLNKN